MKLIWLQRALKDLHVCQNLVKHGLTAFALPGGAKQVRHTTLQTAGHNFYILGAGPPPNFLQTIIVHKEECFERIKYTTEPLKPLCTTQSSGLGDSGAGLIQEINGRETVVAVNQGTLQPLTNNEITQNVAIVMAPLEANFSQRHVPLRWIKDHIDPNF